MRWKMQVVKNFGAQRLLGLITHFCNGPYRLTLPVVPKIKFKEIIKQFAKRSVGL